MHSEDLGIAVQLGAGEEERVYRMAWVPSLQGWSTWVDRGSGTGSWLAIIRDRGEAQARHGELVTEIARLKAKGWHEAARGDPRGPRPSRQVAPGDDLRAVVEPFMERLHALRWAFDTADPTGGLREGYERWRCALEAAGFRVSGRERLARARQYRRLGELAETAGDPGRAIRFYRAALASWSQVGVKRRLRTLEQAGWVSE